MKRHPLRTCVLACILTASTATASEQNRPSERDEIPPHLKTHVTFLHGHPDLRWQIDGGQKLHQKRFREAMGSFLRAARHGDKPSQAAIAEMHWKGEGIARDRAAAYAWMDLAAERGYRQFLLKREAMWQDLDESERLRALETGEDLYALYGDEVAKPRLRRVMRREQARHVGSRIGADVYASRRIGGLPMVRRVSGGAMSDSDLVSIHAGMSQDFYNARFWQPEAYWAIQDRQWNGEVIVHSIREDDDDRP